MAISLAEFEENPQYRRGSREAFERYLGLCQQTFFQDGDDAADEIRALDIRALWEDDNALAAAHALIRTVRLGDSESIFEHWSEATPELKEERDLWNWVAWYQRAEREYTLGTIDTERRIAVGFVYTIQPLVDASAGTDLVRFALYRAKEELARQTRARKRLQVLDKPRVFLEGREQIERRCRYVWLALKQNQRWLTEFFSR